MDGESGSVHLVGAGPGDPELITVGGLRLLQRADVVVHDRLIAPALLDEAPATAQIIDVGKVPGTRCHSQDEINTMLISHARRGAMVVRLKGGDPFVFGRGWEELRACRNAGIDCTVIPGVSSAIAVPAAVGIPVSLRRVSRSIAIVTAQNGDGTGAASLNYEALLGMDTVVVLMGHANLDEIARRFMASGADPKMPAACIERGTMPKQRVVTGTLVSIAGAVERARLQPPMTTVFGDVVRCGDDWPDREDSRGNSRAAAEESTDTSSGATGLGDGVTDFGSSLQAHIDQIQS